jgi:hypothetical protein
LQYTKATSRLMALAQRLKRAVKKSTTHAKDSVRTKSKFGKGFSSVRSSQVAGALILTNSLVSPRRLLVAMGSMSAETRCMVPIKYKQMFDKKLKDVMKSECGKKDFGTALQFLAQPPDAAEAGMIHKACSGFGTNELLLATILCGRSNKEMILLKVCW